MLTRTPVSSPCVVVYTIHTTRHVKVRYWHIADVLLALMNDRFEGNNGHDAEVT
jgi:hypothetical protein